MKIREKVKLDFEKMLFNIMMSEINKYLEVMGDEDVSMGKKLADKIMEVAKVGVEKDGTEYAVVELCSKDAENLIFILALVASVDVHDDMDYYAKVGTVS